ncbi:MAG: type 1 glutamine amidotransferase domain-containing protein [Halobacteriales archaeon]|nr:type 1 glutamine amidotransferase domain-containing protein [Halobacteriales archaeon]
MRLEGTTIAILASNEFEDIELEFPLLRLSEEGADILLVPYQAGHHPRPSLEVTGTKPVTGRYGTPIPPDVMAEGNRYTVVPFDDLAVEDFDALLLPGGFSPDHLRTESAVVEFVRETYDAGTVVAAICHGPQVLIEADLVDGKRVTSYAAVKTDLENAGATYEDVPAIIDGHLVTGRVPDDLPEFCAAVTEALTSPEPSVETTVTGPAVE